MLEGLSATALVFVKLDAQGTELSILQGAQPLFNTWRIVGIEMESTLLAQPIMKGSGKFWQACEYLESQGFELLNIKPISAVSRSGRKKKNQNTYLTECDAVFALRPDVVLELGIDCRLGLLAFYLTNHFYDEVLWLLECDKEIGQVLHSKGCRLNRLLCEIKNAT